VGSFSLFQTQKGGNAFVAEPLKPGQASRVARFAGGQPGVGRAEQNVPLEFASSKFALAGAFRPYNLCNRSPLLLLRPRQPYGSERSFISDTNILSSHRWSVKAAAGNKTEKS
jgi:hypothetical protein